VAIAAKWHHWDHAVGRSLTGPVLRRSAPAMKRPLCTVTPKGTTTDKFAFSVLLQLFVPYRSYVHVLKWLTLVLFAYVATVFVVKIPWETVALRTILPHLSWKSDYITTVVAVLGTTISPYLFFWQASQEVRKCTPRPVNGL
jgi:predicted exporter